MWLPLCFHSRKWALPAAPSVLWPRLFLFNSRPYVLVTRGVQAPRGPPVCFPGSCSQCQAFLIPTWSPIPQLLAAVTGTGAGEGDHAYTAPLFPFEKALTLALPDPAS